MRRLVVLLAGVATVSCSSDTSTSSNTLTPTTTILPTTTAFAPDATTAPTGAATTVVTSTAAPTTEAPAATTAAPPRPTPTSDVAAAFIGGPDDGFWLPLGYWDGTDWVQQGEEDETTPLEFPAATGDALRTTGLDLTPAASTLGASGEACFDGRIGFAVGVAVPTPEPPGFGYAAIGVVGDWEIQPRPARQVGLEIEEYRQIGARYANELGVDGTLGEVVQVVRTDLDGDGMEEVLVTFEHADESILGAPGDYSIVYVRAPQIGGPVLDSVVFSWSVDPDLPDEEIPFMMMARVLGVADLNGDGRMEVALHTWYYEGAGATVFEFDGPGLTEVMSNGCGA